MRSVWVGELQSHDIRDAPMESSPGLKDRIMHAKVTCGSHVLMASDESPGGPVQVGNNFSVCIQCESLEEIEAFLQGAQRKSQDHHAASGHFLGRSLCMLKDQFGIQWMFNSTHPNLKDKYGCVVADRFDHPVSVGVR